ncbi:helix-turn-helix domain-containing protein [Paenibacillus sp. IB182496]|uniref:Helix-turn-helix domain-containing protein n=1 Tax=Paenibacillus sabuli TaxID=2772509 RepID=A0A927BU96_9BACL|nr:AraC family transcriptional regulator [Paenibacillus sabuli]MBD2845991.1 helix-turn-helix domain-containing protein [Paenibacillus sabuli]
MKTIHLYESKHQESYRKQDHHHHNYQILYAIEGEGTIRLEDAERPFAQNCAAVIFPYSNHAVASSSKLTLLVLEFDAAWMEGEPLSRWREAGIDGSLLLQLPVVSASEMKQLLRKLLFEQQQQDGLGGWAMKIYWLELLLLLARARTSAAVTGANDLRAERIRDYIDSHYYQPLTASTLAYALGISSRHATAIFKDKYQITPMQYLAEVRVDTAKKLLLESDKDTISIGFEVGYESLPTFYRVFKNSVQMSPSKFRQEYREDVIRQGVNANSERSR